MRQILVKQNLVTWQGDLAIKRYNFGEQAVTEKANLEKVGYKFN